jgi:hypothetical protein
MDSYDILTKNSKRLWMFNRRCRLDPWDGDPGGNGEAGMGGNETQMVEAESPAFAW